METSSEEQTLKTEVPKPHLGGGPGEVPKPHLGGGTGEAQIKEEFINPNYVPKLVAEYLPDAFKEEIQQYADSKAAVSDGPPSKKIKLKGKNKRQHDKRSRQNFSERLCPAVIAETECTFGERCRYLHDKEAYLKSKPEDLGKECYIFKTIGKCPYGLACRFGSSHISDDLTNITNFELYEKCLKNPTTLNQIDKKIQVTLRKREYDFSKANKVWKNVKAQTGSKRLNLTEKVKEEVRDDSNIESPNERLDKDTDSVSTRPDPATDNIKQDPSKNNSNDNMPMNIGDNKSKMNDQDRPNSLEQSENVGASCTNDDKTVSDMGVSCTAVDQSNPTVGCWTDVGEIRLRQQEKKQIDFSNKLYLAPLTTVGNLPFRRICKEYGADITCGEMAMSTNILQGQLSEWALLKRHHTEDVFGVQLCGGFPDSMTRCAQLLQETVDIDFIDINLGCPIDLVFKRGEGSALMGRLTRLEQIIRSMVSVLDMPLTVKMRTGIHDNKQIAHSVIDRVKNWGVDLITLHGRTREQRYTRLADWDYINRCAEVAKPVPLYGNGDILSFEDANLHREQTGVAGLMLARGALIKPWLFTEIKEQRHWDISANERLEMLKKYANYGLEHWGSDQQGVDLTRRFLLEWQSFLHRYIPVGILERVPQKINERPPAFFGRNDLETLMASANSGDWVKISEMLLGPVPPGFTFIPKHKANAYK